MSKELHEYKGLYPMNDTEVLEWLAKWFDVKDKPGQGKEVQNTLRRIAKELASLKEENERLNEHRMKIEAMEVAERIRADTLAASHRELMEALEQLMSFQNGPPLPTYEKGWNLGMEMCQTALTRAESLLQQTINKKG